MVKEGADGADAIRPVLRGDVLRPGDAWPDDVMARCYELYSTVGVGNCAYTLRLYAAEAGPNASVPALRTVQEWARFYDWSGKASHDVERTYGRRLHQLRQQWFALMEQSAANLGAMAAGELDNNPAAAAIRLKVAEIVKGPIEKGILTLNVPASPTDTSTLDYNSLSTEEKQALAREIMQERKGKPDG